MQDPRALLAVAHPGQRRHAVWRPGTICRFRRPAPARRAAATRRRRRTRVAELGRRRELAGERLAGDHGVGNSRAFMSGDRGRTTKPALCVAAGKDRYRDEPGLAYAIGSPMDGVLVRWHAVRGERFLSVATLAVIDANGSLRVRGAARWRPAPRTAAATDRGDRESAAKARRRRPC